MVISVIGESNLLKKHYINFLINKYTKDGYHFGRSFLGKNIIISNKEKCKNCIVISTTNRSDADSIIDLNNPNDFYKIVQQMDGIKHKPNSPYSPDDEYKKIITKRNDKYNTLSKRANILVPIIFSDDINFIIDNIDDIDLREIEIILADIINGRLYESLFNTNKEIIKNNKQKMMKILSKAIKSNSTDEFILELINEII